MNIRPLTTTNSNHPVSEERMNRLRQASEQARKDMEKIEAKINTMSQKEIDDTEAMMYAMEDPDIEYYTSIGDDGYNQSPNAVDNSTMKVNYNNMPQNTITYNNNVSQNIQPNINTIYNNYHQPVYPDKYRFYNLNPRYYFDAKEMEDHFEALEAERKRVCDNQLGMAMFSVKLAYTLRHDAEEYEAGKKQAEDMYKFIPAEEIMKKRREEEQKLYAQRQKNPLDNPNYEYNERGMRKQKEIIFSLDEIDLETGEVTTVYTNADNVLVDEDGTPVSYHSILQDRQEAMQTMFINNAIAMSDMRDVQIANILRNNWLQTQQQHAIWKAQGKDVNEEYYKSQVDYKANERRIKRFLSTIGYSKERFEDLLHKCCNTDLNYNNTTNVFRMSYDMARDLHLANMLKTPEEMAIDKKVTDRLKEEYEIKRNIFINKVHSGNLRCDTSYNGRASKNILPKPNIDQMTLEDHFKPENMTPYAKIENPQYYTENAFVGKITAAEALNQLRETMPPEQFVEIEKYFISPDGNLRPNLDKITFSHSADLTPEERAFLESGECDGYDIEEVYDANGNLISYTANPTGPSATIKQSVLDGYDDDSSIPFDPDDKINTIDVNKCSLEDLEKELGF